MVTSVHGIWKKKKDSCCLSVYTFKSRSSRILKMESQVREPNEEDSNF